jgi:hypothetical protein
MFQSAWRRRVASKNYKQAKQSAILIQVLGFGAEASESLCCTCCACLSVGNAWKACTKGVPNLSPFCHSIASHDQGDVGSKTIQEAAKRWTCIAMIRFEFTVTCCLFVTVSGSVCSAVTVIQAHVRGHDARTEAEGVLVLTVLRGIKLKDRELFGKQDPYVVASLASGTSASLVCAPVWFPVLLLSARAGTLQIHRLHLQRLVLLSEVVLIPYGLQHTTTS